MIRVTGGTRRNGAKLKQTPTPIMGTAWSGDGWKRNAVDVHLRASDFLCFVS